MAADQLNDLTAMWRCAIRECVERIDARRKQVEASNSYRGRVTNVGQAMAGPLQALADELWAFRDLNPTSVQDAYDKINALRSAPDA